MPSSNCYENPALMRWIDSYEGVPDWTDPAETPAEREARSPLAERVYELFALAGTTLPGLALTAAIAFVATNGARALGTSVLGFEPSPVSPILVAILIGLATAVLVGGVSYALIRWIAPVATRLIG